MLTRVAVLSTLRAPGTDYLLQRDPNRGRRYEIVAFLASDPGNADLATFAAAGVPTAVHDIRAFYSARRARLTDLGPRPAYDRALLERLSAYEPDLLVLCGYLHILTAPVLEAFPGRIINIHDSDLALLGSDGRPKYRGLRSTRDAVFAGEPETRSTVHVVTAEVDVGQVLIRSKPFPVSLANPGLAPGVSKAYAYGQREWMMREAWGPMLARAITLLADPSSSRALKHRLVLELGPEGLAAPASFATRPHAEPVPSLRSGQDLQDTETTEAVVGRVDWP